MLLKFVLDCESMLQEDTMCNKGDEICFLSNSLETDRSFCLVLEEICPLSLHGRTRLEKGCVAAVKPESLLTESNAAS